jgi:hypothetical protein
MSVQPEMSALRTAEKQQKMRNREMEKFVKDYEEGPIHEGSRQGLRSQLRCRGESTSRCRNVNRLPFRPTLQSRWTGEDGSTIVPTSIPTEHSRHNSQHSSSSGDSSETDGTVTSPGSTPENMDMPQALEVHGSGSEECTLKMHSEDAPRVHGCSA